MFTSDKDNKLSAAKDGMLNEGGHTFDDPQKTGAFTHNKEDWEGMARRTGQRAHELMDSSGHNLTHAGLAVKTKIRDNPIQSSLIALGLGLVIGKLFRR